MENKTSVEKVKEFHELFEHPVGDLVTPEPLKIRQLRIALLFEELAELAEAGDVRRTMNELCQSYTEIYLQNRTGDGDNVNKVEELDALCDIHYVADGKAVTSGLHNIIDQAFDLVHENNMKKAHDTEAEANETMRHYIFDKGLSDNMQVVERFGKFMVVRGDGKLLKPKNHKKVDLTVLFK